MVALFGCGRKRTETVADEDCRDRVQDNGRGALTWSPIRARGRAEVTGLVEREGERESIGCDRKNRYETTMKNDLLLKRGALIN